MELTITLPDLAATLLACAAILGAASSLVSMKIQLMKIRELKAAANTTDNKPQPKKPETTYFRDSGSLGEPNGK